MSQQTFYIPTTVRVHNQLRHDIAQDSTDMGALGSLEGGRWKARRRPDPYLPALSQSPPTVPP
jgi:hypothetical protein